MSKKATLFTLEEALKLVLGAIILVFTVVFIWNLAAKVLVDKKVDPMIRSFDELSVGLMEMQDGQFMEMPIFAGDGYIMVGFENGIDMVTGTCDGPDVSMQMRFSEALVKPPTHCGEGGCFCIYKATVMQDNNFAVEQPPLKCVPLSTSLVGGTFKISKDYIKVRGLWERWTSTLPDVVEISCGPAVIPSVGGLVLIQAFRTGDMITLCWGAECNDNVDCTTFGDIMCAQHKDKCYPYYASWDLRHGIRSVEFDGCDHCPEREDFRCSMISTKCTSDECKTACQRNHCGVSCTFGDNRCR